jgi:glycosyltransferase 2 family protein
VIDMLVFLILFILGLYVFLRQLTNVASGYLANFLNGFTQEKIIILIIIFVIGIITLLVLYFFRHKLRNKLLFSKMFDLFLTFRNGLFSLLKIKQWPLFVLYTLLIWICYLLMTYLCFMALEETMHLSLVAAFASLTFGTIGIIVVQGGIGVYPVIVAETLFIFGISTTIGYALGWLTWLAQTAILLLMGLWALAYLVFKKGIKIHDIRKSQEENPEQKAVV